MAFQVRKKETTVAFLLWWFLGMFGGHRFYCNRTGSGVAMLLITLISIPLTIACVGYIGLAAMTVWWIVDAFSLTNWVQWHNQMLMNQIENARFEHEQLSRHALPMRPPDAPPSNPGTTAPL